MIRLCENQQDFKIKELFPTDWESGSEVGARSQGDLTNLLRDFAVVTHSNAVLSKQGAQMTSQPKANPRSAARWSSPRAGEWKT